MYVAIYGYDFVDQKRQHLGNLIGVEYNTSEKTFEIGNASLKGFCDFDMKRALLYVICDDRGRKITSGFTKNVKPDTKESSMTLSFGGEDFKRIFDTDILLDFTHVGQQSHLLEDMFAKVCDAVFSSKDPFISSLNKSMTIPSDSTDTKAIADYTGQYFIVNALNFLKVYLAFYNYYIFADYDPVSDMIIFEFKKAASTIVSIKLKDFIHEKTASDLKTNKTVATIKFEVINQAAEWSVSDLAYWNTQEESNRGSVVGSVLPSVEGYADGFALQMVEDTSWLQSNLSEYNTSLHKVKKFVLWTDPLSFPTYPPTMEQVIEAAGDSDMYDLGSVIRGTWYDSEGTLYSGDYTYIKVNPLGTTTYYELDGATYTPRPTLPEKVYTLGSDNQIYNGYAPDNKRIFPIVAKIYESKYLSEAQIEAVYELVNNRYIENIIVTSDSLVAPFDLSALELYTMIRVYDDAGTYKDIPISEKNTTFNANGFSTTVKLGFKKTLLTEIIKNDIGNNLNIETGGGSVGTTVIKEEMQIWKAEEQPNPDIYKIWFKPWTP